MNMDDYGTLFEGAKDRFAKDLSSSSNSCHLEPTQDSSDGEMDSLEAQMLKQEEEMLPDFTEQNDRLVEGK